MLILISPAKTLDFTTPAKYDRFTKPEFIAETATLVQQLRQLSAAEIASLMKISDKLGELNASRWQTWQADFDSTNAKQALLAFQGDVYQGMNVDSYQPSDFDFAQDHLRILSGLYGVLRPLDLIQPYRLEMGTKLAHAKLDLADTLYDFWQHKLSQAIAKRLESDDKSNDIASQRILINLASQEYFKAVKPKLLDANIITPIFKDWKNDRYKIISFYAKKARGMMARYIIKNRLKNPQGIKDFNEAGYSFNSELSNSKDFVFTRRSC